MKNLDWRANLRLIVLIIIAVLSFAVFTVIRVWLKPAIEEWRELRERTQTQREEYQSLAANLALRDRVDAQFKELKLEGLPDEPDEIVLSTLLRDIESFSRFPTLTLVNMRPLPVQKRGDAKIFSVKMALSGKLQEILQFVGTLGKGSSVIGVESFSLRAVQGETMVECGLSLWMVRLLDDGATKKPALPPAHSVESPNRG